MLHQVKIALDNGNLVGACLLDLQKAFDTTVYKLILKVKHYGMRDKELYWFKSYLFNWQIQDHQNVSLSEEKHVYVDASQGLNGRCWDLCYLYCFSMTYQAILNIVKL